MKENEFNIFLTNDYIYVPYDSKEQINLKESGIIYKNDIITTYQNKKEHSPVSGKAYGLSEINSVQGPLKVLIIENDFKDKTEKRITSIKDIYELSEGKIKEIISPYITEKSLTLSLSYKNKHDLKDQYLLTDFVKELLETLNIIEITCNIPVKIALDKKDLINYQTLFTYTGTYPNIEINIGKKDKSELVTIYDILDLYNKLKNRISRDFIYLTIIHKNTVNVIKTKRYSNLKDLLVHLNIMSTNIVINEKIKIENANFLLDENVYLVNIN